MTVVNRMKEGNAYTKDSTSNLEKIITKDISWIGAVLIECDHCTLSYNYPTYRKKRHAVDLGFRKCALSAHRWFPFEWSWRIVFLSVTCVKQRYQRLPGRRR